VALAPDQVSSIAAPVAQAATATPTLLPPAATPTPRAATPAPLPVTGNSPQDNGIVSVLLPALLVLILGVAGWWSLRARR